MSEQEKEVVTNQEAVERSESSVETTIPASSEPVGSAQQESKDEVSTTKEDVVAPEATREEEPSHPPLVDFSKATIRFQCEDIRPKSPKKTKRQPVVLPLYSPRVQTTN